MKKSIFIAGAVFCMGFSAQAEKTKSLHDDKLWNVSKRGGVPGEVSDLGGLSWE